MSFETNSSSVVAPTSATASKFTSIVTTEKEDDLFVRNSDPQITAQPKPLHLTFSRILSQQLFGKSSSTLQPRNNEALQHHHQHHPHHKKKHQKLLMFEVDQVHNRDSVSKGGRSSIKVQHGRYLTSALDFILVACLQDVCEKRPEDPIEFMAKWLYCYADSRIYLEEKAAFIKSAAEMSKELKSARQRRLERMKALRGQISSLVSVLVQLSPDSDLFSSDSMSKVLSAIEEERSIIGSLHERRSSVSAPQDAKMLDYLGRIYRMQSQASQTVANKQIGRRQSAASSRPNSGAKGKRNSYGYDVEGDDEEEDSYDSGEDNEDDDEGGDSDVYKKKKNSVGRRASRPTQSRVKTTSSSVQKLTEVSTTSLSGKNMKKSVKWLYEVPPGRIVCIHPILGRLASPLATTTKEESLELNWLLDSSNCLSLYQPEIYNCLPDEMLYVTPPHLEDESGSSQTQIKKKDSGRLKKSRSGSPRRQGSAPSSPRMVPSPRMISSPVSRPFSPVQEGEESWSRCEGFIQQLSRTPSPRRKN